MTIAPHDQPKIILWPAGHNPHFPKILDPPLRCGTEPQIKVQMTKSPLKDFFCENICHRLYRSFDLPLKLWCFMLASLNNVAEIDSSWNVDGIGFLSICVMCSQLYSYSTLCKAKTWKQDVYPCEQGPNLHIQILHMSWFKNVHFLALCLWN